MPSTPTTNSTPGAATPTTGSKSRGGKKVAAKSDVADATLVDKTVQKTTRKSSTKSKGSSASTFEKPAEADWHRLISEAAYYRAERRGFHPGYEQEDWAWAEEDVRKILSP